MTATGRLIGIVLLATLLAAAGTLFGALAVPQEHAHGAAAEHHEAEAAHEAPETLGAGDFAAAPLVSVAGVGIVPVALRSARRRPELERPGAQRERGVTEALRVAVALASAGAATIHFASSRSTSRSTGSSASSSSRWRSCSLPGR